MVDHESPRSDSRQQSFCRDGQQLYETSNKNIVSLACGNHTVVNPKGGLKFCPNTVVQDENSHWTNVTIIMPTSSVSSFVDDSSAVIIILERGSCTICAW